MILNPYIILNCPFGRQKSTLTSISSCACLLPIVTTNNKSYSNRFPYILRLPQGYVLLTLNTLISSKGKAIKHYPWLEGLTRMVSSYKLIKLQSRLAVLTLYQKAFQVFIKHLMQLIHTLSMRIYPTTVGKHFYTSFKDYHLYHIIS